jgi:hypothetical protein
MSNVEIASDTVKTQLASMTLEINQLKNSNETLTTENEQLKRANVELASVIENDLVADLKIKIMAASNYTEKDLDSLKVEDLQRIEETLTRSKGFTGNAIFKSVRAGNASMDNTSRLTVGSLYGKPKEEIIKQGGQL